MNYSFDDGSLKTQEIKYIVTVLKGKATTPGWKYRLFPGM
jgi:hypothetical protein